MGARTVAVSLAVLVIGSTELLAQTRVRSPSPGAQLKALGPPPVGPAPQGFTSVSAGTYGVFAKVAWNPAPNAASYEVSRGKIDDPNCCNATSGALPATATSWGEVGLYRPGSYLYTLTVNYADGSVGKDAFTLVVQHGVAPTPFKVEDLAPGRVRITWNLNILNVNAIKISGPGVAGGYGVPGEKVVVGGGPIDLRLPAGTHTWKVATAYDVTKLPVPLPINYGTSSAFGTTYVAPAPPSEWAEVSHTVNLRSERFRISIERFQAVAPAAEDAVRSDGRGNEVYVLTQVNEYRNWGRPAGAGPVSAKMLRTPTFGDVQNYPNRIRAGSSSPSGGIQANDEYPAAVQLISQLQPATTANLPFLLWEGELTEIDGAVILSPSIWEADEDERLVPHFVAFQAATAGNLRYLNDLYPFMPWNPSGASDLWRPIRCPRTASGPSYFTIPQTGGWGDEPVDLADRQGYCQTYLAINWRMASSYTSVNPAAVVEVPFDGTAPWGRYKLFLRIEKVPQAPAMVAPVRTLRRSVP